MATVQPKSKRLIKQADLRDIAEKREFVKGLAESLKREKEDLDKRELVIMHLVNIGVETEAGSYDAAIIDQPGQRRPRWKEEFARLAGAAEVERVTEETEPTPPTPRLVITMNGKVLKAVA